jgi:alpha,alpha-trehalose phosphorylase
MEREAPDHFTRLKHRTDLDPAEAEAWQQAADRMYVPYDEALGIHPQDDSFLDKEPWDFENTPRDRYPLLLHYHPLVIYRHQVIKQADVVLAMFLLGNEFSEETKQRNFDFYDPKTTGDSSLSSCIQAIVAAECGYYKKANRYMRYAALMDLADIGGNVRDGLHMASMGGTWMSAVYGLAGLRDFDGRISFTPRPPLRLDAVRFSLAIRGRRIRLEVNQKQARYSLVEGDDLTLWHLDEEIMLTRDAPVVERAFNTSVRPRG